MADQQMDLVSRLGGIITAELGTFDEDLYVPGTRSWDWRAAKVLNRAPGTYEAMLASFLSRDPGADDWPGENIMVVVGGIGTGKSTALNRAIEKACNTPRPCSKCATTDLCAAKPVLMQLDFTTWHHGHEHDAASEVDMFWNSTAAQIDGVSREIPLWDEISKFWSWLDERPDLRQHSIAVNRLISEVGAYLRALKGDQGWSKNQLMQMLNERYTSFFKDLPPRELAWYRALRLIYVNSLANGPCRCHYLFLDNIDHASPETQRVAVSFVLDFGRLSKARTIVAVRPLTWATSLHAQELIRTENHYSPEIRAVLESRVAHARTTLGLSPRDQNDLEYLVSLVTNDRQHRLSANMFAASSGISLRFGLRNFENMLASKLIPRITRARGGQERMSDTAEAYFYASGRSLVKRAFENLYQVGGDRRAEYALIKPRVLDLLCRVGGGVMTVRRLLSSLRRFNYVPSVVDEAITELMHRERPLMWCDSSLKFDRSLLDARLAATPIGYGYYETLFGELYYEEICLREAKGATSPERQLPLREVYDAHLALFDEDMRQVEKALQADPDLDGDTGQYFMTYTHDLSAITQLHARRLTDSMSPRFSSPETWFDPGREHQVRAEVMKLLIP